MTMLSVITRVMNVGDQKNEAFATCSAPFCDSSCKFVHGPKNVKSTNSGQVQAFQDNLWAYFREFSNWFQFLLLEVMVVQTRSWDFVLAISFIVLFEHVLPCRRTTLPSLREVFPSLAIFQLFQQKFVIRTFFVFLNNIVVRFAFTLSASLIHVVTERCWFSKINQLHQFLPHGTPILLSSSHSHVVHVYRQECSMFPMNK